MAKLILEKQDPTYLQWSHVRSSSGTAGTLLKATSSLHGKKKYYKLSNFDSVKGIVGHECINEMNYPHRLHVRKGFCYAAKRHEPARCSMHPAEQGMSTMPLSHWLTFGNTFLKMFAAPFMSAFVIVPS